MKILSNKQQLKKIKIINYLLIINNKNYLLTSNK